MGKPILVTTFNQKGGIGKTTATYNFGHTLSQISPDLRVLLIDADPQGSLTSLVYSELFLTPDGQERFYTDCEQKRNSEQNPVYVGMGDIFYPSIQAENPLPIDVQRFDRIQLTPIHDYSNLFIIPSHVTVGNLDGPAELGIQGLGFYRQFPGAITEIFRKFAEKHNIDIVLFDLNPSVGAFNRSIIMGSDYLSIPFFPDYVCMSVIQNLKAQIPVWHDRDFSRIFEKPPLFLGAFPQKLRTRTDHGVVKYEQSYGKYINSIYAEVEKLIERLTPIRMIPPHFRLKKTIGIRDMVSLGLDVQVSGHPICDLSYPHRHQQENEKSRTLTTSEKAVKHDVNLCYKKVVGSLFRNMTEEDKLSIGEYFSPTMERYSFLYEAIDVSSISGNPNPIEENRPHVESPYIEVAHDDPAIIIHDVVAALYDNDQVDRLLNHYFRDRVADVRVITPIQGDHDFLGNGELREVLNQVIEHSPEEMTFILPLNLGSIEDRSALGHWVLAVFQHIQGQYNVEGQDDIPARRVIMYFDPLGLPIELNLKRELEQPFRDRNIECNTDSYGERLQTDSINCGPWIIEFARVCIFNKILLPASNEINARRAQHRQDCPEAFAQPQPAHAQPSVRARARRRTNEEISNDSSSRFFPSSSSSERGEPPQKRARPG